VLSVQSQRAIRNGTYDLDRGLHILSKHVEAAA
jgi:hypothetical protein